MSGRAEERLKQAKELLADKWCVVFGNSLFSYDEKEQLQGQLMQQKQKLAKEETDLKEQLHNVKEKENVYKAAYQHLPELSGQKEELEKQLREKNEQLMREREEAAALQKEFETMKEGLKFADEQTAKEQINEMQTKKTMLESAVKQAHEAAAKCDNEIKEKQAAQKALVEQLQSGDCKELSVLTEDKNRLTEQLKGQQIAKESVNRRFKNNESAKENIEKEWVHLSQVEKEYKLLKSLSDTANGGLTGKDKIMLETYIQATYFDRILLRANARFSKMSNGQYELVRKKNASNLKNQSGLDIDVRDHYNGSFRSVKTLSGGESFMASLSLALGLSDEIQAAAGGIQLDTMFVDEGFGSLDDETLSVAIRTLNELTEGNRLVGIISHVSELKQSIDKQIVVTKKRESGSRVAMECG